MKCYFPRCFIVILSISLLAFSSCKESSYVYLLSDYNEYDSKKGNITLLQNTKLKVVTSDSIQRYEGCENVEYNGSYYTIPKNYLFPRLLPSGKLYREKVFSLSQYLFDTKNIINADKKSFNSIRTKIIQKYGKPIRVVKTDYAPNHGEKYKYPSWTFMYDGLNISVCYLPLYHEYIFDGIEIYSSKPTLLHGIYVSMPRSELENILGAPISFYENSDQECDFLYDYGSFDVLFKDDKVFKIIARTLFK